MSNGGHRFFLRAIEPDYGCPVLETMFRVDNLDDLRAILGISAADDPDFEGWHLVEPPDLAQISMRFGVGFNPGDRPVFLVSWHPVREFPYLPHGGYELFLLLYGTKKLAAYNEPYPPAGHFNEELFNRWVAEGLLHKEVQVESFEKPIHKKDGRVIDGLRQVYYTPKGEEWRIPAMRLLWAAAAKSGWNESFERLEGMLFGYEGWEIDWWIAHCRERGAGWVGPTRELK